MKKILAMSSMLMLATIPPAHAGEFMPAKKGATFLGSAATGVALGGPIGMLAGAVVGVWLSGQVESAEQFDQAQLQLADANTRRLAAEQQSRALQLRLETAEQTSAQYAQLVLDQLELEMLFKTGKSTLTEPGRRRLESLALFLTNNQQLAIRLDGFADPRGTADFNAELSQARVSYVAEMLLSQGVSADRIESFSHGASQTSAAEGDHDAYALERVVRINLAPSPNSDYAQAD